MHSLDINGRTYKMSAAKIAVRGYPHPVTVRLDHCDLLNFQQIFHGRELEVELPFSPQLIIDAGAYVGYATVWFANRYPAAHIVAIEPDPGNFEQLLENTRHYQNIDCVNAAVWSRRRFLQITRETECGRSLEDWELVVTETDGASNDRVYARPIEDFVAENETIDILKMDVEGAELRIFSEIREDVLSHIRCVIIELHDRFRPGCHEAVFAALNADKWDISESGEKAVFIQKADS